MTPPSGNEIYYKGEIEMKTVGQKLNSRKLWAAIVGVIMGLAMVFGLDENTVTTVAGAVMALVSVVTYIVAEGKIDADAVKNAAQQVQDAIDAVEPEK